MYDSIVIGSGPAGLSAAVYAKRANVSVAVVEKEYEGTGQIAESENVNNYLGLPNSNGYELGEKFREHALSLEVPFLEKEVVQIVPLGMVKDRVYEITFDDDTKELAKTVIYAAGAYPRKANIKGEAEYAGKGVSYCAICDGAFYKNKTVAVLGGGDTALDDARYLADICEKVYLVHRREQFRGAQSTVELLKKRENVEFVLKEQVTEIFGEKKIAGIRLQSGKTLEVNGVFVAYGSIPQSGLVKDIVKLDEAGYVVAGEDGVTCTADGTKKQLGFFVAGDVRTKKLRQVVTAVSDGANALNSAIGYLSDTAGCEE